MSKTTPAAKKGRLSARLLAVLVLLSGIWGTIALAYQWPGCAILRVAACAVWAALAILGTVATWRGRFPATLGHAAAFALLLLWWSGIEPSNQREWADDVARPLTGTVQGHQVVLDNVRDFHWRSDDDYDARWHSRRYDLDQLVSADAVLSYWGSRAIAHAMISFGFADGSHVVFSVEIRRERGEQYSPVGGFFKQFELALVAAEERDIIRVRTNVRGEDDYLYPLHMDPAAMRALFVSYVDAANALAKRPRFYNTLTSNCTTIVHRMARRIVPGLHRDIRLLLTGYLPGYLRKIGALDDTQPLDVQEQRARITDRARHSTAEDFSRAIRQETAAR